MCLKYVSGLNFEKNVANELAPDTGKPSTYTQSHTIRFINTFIVVRFINTSFIV